MNLSVLWRRVSWKTAGRAALEAIGALWLLVEVTAFLVPDTAGPLRQHYWAYLVVVGGWTIFAACPRIRVREPLNGRDTTIELAITDIFRENAAVVVPINSAFDASLAGRVDRAQSVQGHFLREYYAGKVEHLMADIKSALERETPEPIEEIQIGGKPAKRYELGTVLKLRQRDRLFYLVAATNVNEHGAAALSSDDLPRVLAGLWDYISTRGDKGDVAAPLIGTGHGGVPIRREEVAKVMVRSFIASCADRNRCPRLVIALHPSDVERHKICLDDLGAFLRCQASHAVFAGSNQLPLGSPVS